MELELVRDAAREFPVGSTSRSVRSLTVWFCKYRSLSPISQFVSLRALKVAGVPDRDLSFLGEMRELEWLSITHLPKVQSLYPLAHLQSLKFLELATLPSWDLSRKRTVIQSLMPLAGLRRLVHVSLLGVLPEDRSLRALEGCALLKSGKFVGYSAKEVAQLIAATGARLEPMPSWNEA